MDKLEIKKSELAQLPLSIPQVIECAYSAMKGEIVTCDDIARIYGLNKVDSIKLITNKIFGTLIHHLSIANAKFQFDSTACNRLMRIIRYSEDDKNVIAAIKAMSDITGQNESKKMKAGSTININLDSIVRDSSKSPYPGF